MNKKKILNNHLETISGIADREYQERVWVRAEGPECDDYTESICHFFDDGDPIIENYQDYDINENQLSELIKFRTALDKFSSDTKYHLGPDFLYTPEWAEITIMAKKVLQAFGYKQAKNVKIKLSRPEYTYLCQAVFIQKKHRETLFSAQQISDVHLLNISEDQANEIRDLCGKQLQIVGFNEKHELTPEGEILDSLLDKFFI